MASTSIASESNWNLKMLVFLERGKPEYPEKNPQSNSSLQHPCFPPSLGGGGGVRERGEGGEGVLGGAFHRLVFLAFISFSFVETVLSSFIALFILNLLCLQKYYFQLLGYSK